MQVSIIGAGNIGSALAQAWSAAGHEIFVGVRQPGNRKYSRLNGLNGVSIVSVAEAVENSHVILLAVPYSAALDLASQSQVSGKILIDATNPIGPGMNSLLVSPDKSGAEEIAERAKGAKVVKAFNTTGSENLLKKDFSGQSGDIFLCGDDAAAKDTVTQLVADIGFTAVDAGSLRHAYLLESLALLWVTLAYGEGFGRDVTFKLIK